MNEIIKEYGEGLFALAVEEGLCDRILEETRMLTPLMTAEYTRLLINPNFPKEKRIAIAGELLDGRVHPYVANFVKLMTERRLASELGDASVSLNGCITSTSVWLRLSQKARLPSVTARRSGLKKS